MKMWLDGHYQWLEDNVDEEKLKEIEVKYGYPQYEEDECKDESAG